MGKNLGRRGQRDGVPQNSLGDEDAWNDAFRPGLTNSPEVAQEVARLLSIIKDSAESDPGGAEAVANLLDSAIHLMFAYTDTYRIARELWMLSLRGVLEWKNEPDQLLKPASEQGNKELERLGRRVERLRV